MEVYHLTIRGANLGSYDGIDAVGENYWIHDNEVSNTSAQMSNPSANASKVTNRDECVCVKSPSHHALIEYNVCNQAGSGISIGSLNVSAEISNIVYSLKNPGLRYDSLTTYSMRATLLSSRETMLGSSRLTQEGRAT